MINFFLGKHLLGEVHECVLLDNEGRGVFHFMGTKKEMDHYVKLNGGKVHLKSDCETTIKGENIQAYT